MIYLIHGENIVDSRRFLLRLKSNYSSIITVRGKNLKAPVFKKTLHEISHSLFNEKTAVEIDQFSGDFSIFPKSFPKDLDVIIWADKRIEKIPQSIKAQAFDKRDNVSSFKLVDAILYKNEKEAQILANVLFKSKEPMERMLGTINRSFYLLFYEKEDALKREDISAFVRKKLAEQSAYWSKSEIRKAMLYLLKTDLDIKNGVNAEAALQTFISRVVTSATY